MLSFKVVSRFYVEEGKSDREIAEILGVHRTTITKFRLKHGITTRGGNGIAGEAAVIEIINSLGYEVSDMNQSDRTYPFDLLVNNRVRVDVKTVFITDGDWIFNLTSKPELGISLSGKNDYVALPSGRMKKDFRRSCDLVVFCGLSEFNPPNFFIMLPTVIPLELTTVRIPSVRENRWTKWKDRWEVLTMLVG